MLGGADCRPFDVVLDGTLLCGSVADWSALSVRHPDGGVIWSVRAPECCRVQLTPRLSPDGQRIALTGVLVARGEGVASMPRLNVPDEVGQFAFAPSGWVDSAHVVVINVNNPAELSLVDVARSALATPFAV